MAAQQRRQHRSALLLLFTLLETLLGARAGQIRYSIPEELEKGSFVGNIAKNLGLEPWELAERGVRIVSRGKTQLFALNSQSGSLITAGRIDREELCAQTARCLVTFNILVEDKMKFYPVEVEIIDINDNTPQFLSEELEVKIPENAPPSSRFSLIEVYDLDVGMNSLQDFKLSSNSHFSVDVQSKTNGPKYPELVLERTLDREEEAIHHLVLTAMDGGDPVRSGMMRIQVTVLDANDNAPAFTKPIYRVSVTENLPVGTPVLSVNATDQDEGVHAELTYSFVKIPKKISQIFYLNPLTGQISTSGDLDYEDSSSYELDVEAQDRPGLRDRAKVFITILDVNDNVPEVVVTSGNKTIAENAPPGTVIALFQVHDRDSGLNGLVTCSISRRMPFELEKSVDNYYRLVTNTVLDREQVSLYNITVTATDKGTPPLSTDTFISLTVADTNDNPPAFSHMSYSVYVPENNPRGASIFSVTAHDPDSDENAQITYSLAEDTIQGAPVSSYVSINSDTGSIYALRAFDYEQFQDLQVRVTARDSGKPPLSSNVSLSLFILDQNDNIPEILYPALPTDGSTGVELAPRSAEPGYLVTKVVAVDHDSGQNAWLSYRLLKASEPGLFTVGVHTGEVRTARAMLDRDSLKQNLVVAVQDHGQPPLSATITLTVAVADSIPDVLADLSSLESPTNLDDSGLTLYLVVAVAAVSCIFLAFVIVLLALRLRRWHSKHLIQDSCGGLPSLQASHSVDVEGVRTFLQTYSHQVSLTADSGKSHIIFPQPNYADTLISAESCGKSEPLLIQEDSGFCKEEDPFVQHKEKTETNQLSRCNNRRSPSYRVLGWHSDSPASRSTFKGSSRKIRRTTMAARQRGGDYRGFFLLCILLGTLWEVWTAHIRYSVPEETDKGSFVGNIAQDLALEPRELAERGVRIVSRDRTQLFTLNPRSGSLITADRIDREELCAQSARCLVNFNILMEDKMNLYPIEVEIMDINDNAPRFLTEEMNVKIMENTAPGVRFPLNEARDPDVGINSLQSYQLSSNHHFSLVVQTGEDGTKYPELVLERVLDREEEAIHHLLLTASDGGDPLRSGTARIQVTVVDVNDHAPVFSLPQYRVTVPENVPVGTTLLTVNAIDLDDGINGEVTYSFRKITQKILQIFQLNSLTGELSTLQGLDYEESGLYEMEVQAQDGPGSLTRTKVLITILDVNDNAPEVTVTSVSSSVPEDTPPGTVIALFYVQDRDSGKNGEVVCTIPDDLPFKLERSIDNYYRLTTAENLDRERLSVYNITIKAIDCGNPPLFTETHICIHVADTNDNPPAFAHTSYSVFIPENNPKGASIFSVTAHDPDSDHNAQVIYSLVEDTLQGAPMSSYVSVNSDNGVLYALRSFDYEQFQNLQFIVTARDSGDPPLSNNVSINLFVLDKNDNVPEILYPTLPTDGSTGMELAPRSAEPGYLVTKVVAVDRDSGQNAWLSYRLLKASEPGLFVVGVHTGEVRTARALQDRDAIKQSLVVAVQDHGQPILSSTVTLTVAVADSIPDVLADLSELTFPTDSDDSGLTLYLVVAVAAVSCLFLTFVMVLLALRLRRWHMKRLFQASGSGLVDASASHFVGVDGVRAFLQTYSHEVSLTADSRTSHLIFPQPNYADTLISQESCEKNDPLLTSIDFHDCKVEAPNTQTR
ncbi:PREDICTED: protocadherin Fat 4-like [Chrysochloris asiatica]|uniref:Protocadherin Fat 4-like n=1 Tax=Chrysochloris asiatica TaxID=185453 RepID=A0A9B0WQH9_CHRAS|nr:PREDICTED: protocadherin Fat 4-like [Chrysochloris asiatica]